MTADEIPSIELLFDLQRVARKINVGHVTCDQYEEHGNHSVGTVIQRFDGWNNANEEAGLDPFLIPREDLLDDLRRVAEKLDVDHVTIEQYVEHGKHVYSTYIRRFDGWNNANEEAGLEWGSKQNKIQIPESILFELLFERAMSMLEASDELGVSYGVIRREVDRHDMPYPTRSNVRYLIGNGPSTSDELPVESISGIDKTSYKNGRMIYYLEGLHSREQIVDKVSKLLGTDDPETVADSCPILDRSVCRRVLS